MDREQESRAGHRARQRQRLLNSGAEALPDKDILEMLLYYALPRVDTKPIAHELLSRYCTLGNILNADYDELKSVAGIKENAEVLFSLLKEVSRRVSEGRVYGSFFEPELAKSYILSLYEGAETELVYALFLDMHGSLLGKKLIFRGSVSSSKFSLRPVTEGVIRSGGTSVIIAHNHPSGSPIPSGDDILTTDDMAAHLAANDISLAEHYVVGKNSVTGILALK